MLGSFIQNLAPVSGSGSGVSLSVCLSVKQIQSGFVFQLYVLWFPLKHWQETAATYSYQVKS